MACQLSAEELKIKESNMNGGLHSTQIIHSSCTPEPKDYKTIMHSNDIQLDQKRKNQRQYCSYWQKWSVFEHIIYFCALASASYVGVLTRIYLSKLSTWNGVELFPSLYPQIVGTTIMGFVTSHKIILSEKYPFFYTAIATGLCGSITTFSSWNSESVSILLQIGHEPPNNAVRILGWVTTLLLGLGMSAGSYTVGCHLASLSPWSDSTKQESSRMHVTERAAAQQDVTSKCHVILKRSVFMWIWIVLTVLVVVIPYFLERWDLMFSALLASIGTYLRWHLAPLNSIFENFKLGTFIVNVAGSWILGAIISVQGVYVDDEKEWISALLIGVGAGFCGCLTTVSTFSVEMSKLPLKASYLYAFVSFLMAQVGLILARGSVKWTSEQ